jgi:hypothetical protein
LKEVGISGDANQIFRNKRHFNRIFRKGEYGKFQFFVDVCSLPGLKIVGVHSSEDS